MGGFDRRKPENGSLGIDDGHGGIMLMLGGRFDGGHVLARPPGLDQAGLSNGHDLAITIDYPEIRSEILSVRLGNSHLGHAFLGYTSNSQGVTR